MGFAGMERDTVTGLNLAMFREENPGTGRWFNQDPVGFAGGSQNLYSYVKNSVPDQADSSGLWDWEGFREGVGGALVGVAVGIVVGTVVVATAPAWLVVGAGVVAAGAGGYLVGQDIYEAVSGSEWSTNGSGRTLTDRERSRRTGQAIVGVATICVQATSYWRQGSRRDWRWLGQSLRMRYRSSRGSIPVSNPQHANIGALPPAQRPVSLLDFRPGSLGKTLPTGPEPAVRWAFPWATPYSQTNRRK
jgi:RHS repeat-associated protein